MKTYELWADIVECEDGLQIDDVGDPALMGTFATQDEAEAARHPHGRRAWIAGTVQGASRRGNLARSAKRA